MSFFTALITSKIAIGALALGTVAAGGTAATAYTGGLPTPLQETAHSLIGAPAPVQAAATTTSTADPVTPDPSSSPDPTAIPTPAPAPDPEAAPAPLTAKPDHAPGSKRSPMGLCEAYAHGGAQVKAAVYPVLVTAASGSADIATYCATVVKKDHKKADKPSDPSNATEGNEPADVEAPAPAPATDDSPATVSGSGDVSTGGTDSHGHGDHGDGGNGKG